MFPTQQALRNSECLDKLVKRSAGQQECRRYWVRLRNFEGVAAQSF